MQSRQKSNQDESGLTFVETLVTLAVVGILALIALPSYQNIVITTRIATATSELHAALYLARSAALKHGGGVSICRSSNGESANPTCTRVNSNPISNAGWGEGWLIYFDRNRDGRFNGNDTLIRAQGKLFKSANEGSIVPSPNRNQINYTATGQTFGTFMRFAINRPDYDRDVSHDRFICIASGGRARVDTSLCTGQ